MSRKSAHFLPLFIAIFEKITMNAQIFKENFLILCLWWHKMMRAVLNETARARFF